MNDTELVDVPPVLQRIMLETNQLGFTLASESKTGALLRTLRGDKARRQFSRTWNRNRRRNRVVARRDGRTFTSGFG